MKTIKETFKAEKEILEEFFKDGINFRDKTVLKNSPVFYSVNIFTYKHHIRDSIRTSIKGFLLYLNSLYKTNGQCLNEIEVTGKETISLEYFPILIVEELLVGNNDFLNQLDNEIYNAEMDDYNLYNVEPFNIVIRVDYHKVINGEKTFKEKTCTICLERIPNVLFCLCGHICVCEKCKKIKTLNLCPICKTENYILRII